jgi:hypothetical protein
MGFELASPLLLGALAIAAPVLVAFLFRRRKEIVRVPSTLLWRRVAVARAPNRRIRSIVRLLAMVACLVAVAALALAAARPVGTSSGETVALVIDTSASMGGGSDGGGLERAKEWAADFLASRGASDRVVLVTAGAEPQNVAGPTHDAAVLSDALDAIEAERGTADLGAAMDVAIELVRPYAKPRVVVLTDGGTTRGVPILEDETVAIETMTFEPDARDNVGITGLAAYLVSDATAFDEREVWVEVATASDEPRRVRVVLSVGPIELARETLAIAPHGHAELRRRLRVDGEVIARVEPADGEHDSSSLDDEARLTVDRGQPGRVVLVRDPVRADASAFFVEQAVRAAGAAEIVQIAPSEIASIGPDDLVIVLGAGGVRPNAPALLLGAAPFGARAIDLDASQVNLRSIDERASLLEGVALDGVTIDRALALDADALERIGGRALVDLDGGTVVAEGGAGRARWIFVGIDPLGSDLVLRVAFPVLVSNALVSLSGANETRVAETVPRAEVTFERAPEDDRIANTAALPSFVLPVSPPALLSGLALLLLFGELALYRRGFVR